MDVAQKFEGGPSGDARMRLRRKLAGQLEEAFARIGKAVSIDPSDLVPTQGYWRTNHLADVYRWEGWGRVPGSQLEISIASWYTMTELVKGVSVAPMLGQDGRQYPNSFEAWPLEAVQEMRQ